MSDTDCTLYGLFATCFAERLPLDSALFANGDVTKAELIAVLKKQLREWQCNAVANHHDA